MNRHQVADPSLGKVFLGKYRIVRLLARGGMGAIYLARNEGAAGFVKPVVVKRILPGSVDAMALRLFEREARIMSHLRHPGIVDVIDFSAEDDGYLMVLDYVHGYHLGKWYRWVQKVRGTFQVDVAVHVLAGVLDALHYAHTLSDADGKALRVIHRDIKPSNIMIDADGHVKLLDFGIAQMVTDRTEVSEATQVVKGTFAYLAPELLRSGGEPTPLSDVYACGVVLHEVLSGRNEFRQADLALTAARVLRHEPTPLAEIRSDISPALSAVVSEAMEKDPARRHTSAQEFARALRSARRLDAERAGEQVLREAQRDFRDPDFTEALGIAPLDQLERAWKNPPEELLRVPSGARTTRSPSRDAEDGDTEATRAMTPAAKRKTMPPTAAPAARRGIPAWIWVTMLVAVGGVAGAAAVVKLNQPPRPQEPPTVVVSGDVSPVDDTRVIRASSPVAPTADPAPVATADQEAPASAPPTQADARRPAPVRPGPRSGNDIDIEPFRAYKNDIDTHCARPNAEEALKYGKIQVRFSVEKSGKVVGSGLVPEAVEKTQLGRCILGYAQKTRFDRRTNPIAFKVPLQLRPQ